MTKKGGPGQLVRGQLTGSIATQGKLGAVPARRLGNGDLLDRFRKFTAGAGRRRYCHDGNT